MNEVGFCPVVSGVLSSGVLSVWGFVLWGFVLWGFVSVGFCPVGFCPYTESYHHGHRHNDSQTNASLKCFSLT